MAMRKAYKGFGPDMRCRDFQYEVGKDYTFQLGEVKLCSAGFHWCENPLDVLRYYPFIANSGALNRYCEVQVGGVIVDLAHKGVSSKITVVKELELSEFVQKGVDWIVNRNGKVDTGTKSQNKPSKTDKYKVSTSTERWCSSVNTGDYGVSANTGSESAAVSTGILSVAANTGLDSVARSTGYHSVAASVGYRSAAASTGDCSVAANTGDFSVTTSSGFQSTATGTGKYSAAINTGDFSAAINTSAYSTTINDGERSIAANIGCHSAASATGDSSVAVAIGKYSRAKASLGSAIVLCEYDSAGKLISIIAGIAGQEGVKPDTWYTVEGGRFVEVSDQGEKTNGNA